MTVDSVAGSTGATPPPFDPGDSLSERVLAIAHAIRDRCIETGQPASVEVQDDDLSALGEDEARFVLRVGMISLVNDAMHMGRCAKRVHFDEDDGGGCGSANGAACAMPSEPRRRPMHAAFGRNPTSWQHLRAITHCGADGLQRPLLKFSVADLDSFTEKARTQRDAWSARERWLRTARKAIDKHGAETIEALPAEVLKKLDGAAGKAWGRA